MKKLLCLLAFVCLLSCGDKSNSSGVYDLEKEFEKATLESEDSDFDGLSNREEKELGLNPFISNIPLIKIKFKNTSISSKDYTLKYNTLKKGYIKYFSNLAYKKNQHDSYLYEEKNLFSIGCLDLASRMRHEVRQIRNPKLKGFYSYDFSKIKNISLISNIKTSIFNDQNDYTQFTNEIDYTMFDHNLNKDSSECLDLEIFDFDYTINQKKFSYREQTIKSKNKLSHFNIISPKGIQKISFNPKHIQHIDKLLKELKIDFKIERGVVSLSGLKNEYPLHANLESLKIRDLEKSRWFFFSSNQTSINDPFIVGERYSLVYLSAADLIESQKKRSWEKQFEINGNKITLEVPKKTQMFVLSIDLKSELVKKENISRWERGTMFGIYYTNPNEHKACLYKKEYKYELLNSLNSDLEFTLDENKGEIKTTYENGRYYLLIKPDTNKITNSFTISIRDQNSNPSKVTFVESWTPRRSYEGPRYKYSCKRYGEKRIGSELVEFKYVGRGALVY